MQLGIGLRSCAHGRPLASRCQNLHRIADAVPPQAWFGVSAVFHYLGPAFAVLLFPHIGVLGVAWLRIASAALIFAPLTRPWRTLRADGRRGSSCWSPSAPAWR